MGLPDFASNYLPIAPDSSVADRVNELFRIMRQNKIHPPSLAIATAYINPGGYVLLADELEQAPHVRLLLGAEPEQESVRAVQADDADRDERISEALVRHDAWLSAERDTMGFECEPTAAAERMVRWLKSTNDEGSQRVEVRRYTGGFLHGKAYMVEEPNTPAALAGSSNMTYAGLAVNAELNLGTASGSRTAIKVSDWFKHYWDQSEPYDLAALYERIWDPHSPWTVYLRMLWMLYAAHLDEEEIPRTTGLSLTNFQADGVARMQRLIAENGGVLVADEVGLGKTYLAGEVIYDAANVNRQRVLIVCPAALKESVWEKFLRDHDFSRWVDVYSYEEVRNRLDEDHPGHQPFITQVGDYSLVVVDEAHNLRNPSARRSDAVDRVLTIGGRPKRVVLLTATPVNNSLDDLQTLIRYFIRDDARFAQIGIPSIRAYIRNAQDTDPANLTPEHLFDLMDQVAVRRTRRFIKENYGDDEIVAPDGQVISLRFPQPRVRRIDYPLDDAGKDLIDSVVRALNDPNDAASVTLWRDRQRDPDRLMLARYTPSMYATSQNLQEYEIRNAGLLRSALLKRLESSPHALSASLTNMIASQEAFLGAMTQGHVLTGEALTDWVASDSDDLDAFVSTLARLDKAQSTDGYHAAELEADVRSDIELLTRLREQAQQVVAGQEPKVGKLVEELTRIASDARAVDARGVSHGDRRKVVVFSSFSDTIMPIREAVIAAIEEAPQGSPLKDYRGRVAPAMMGAYASTLARGETGSVDQGGRAATIAGFAPRTAGPRGIDGDPTAKDEFDLLFTTDVLAEGVNLQQAGNVINYDLPWNPMRIVQRNGRIDRINSQHEYVDLGLFFPSERLEELLALEARLEAKLALADAAVGAGEVLPGRMAGPEINLADTDVELEFERLLDNGGSSASLSGEEYRRRLARAFESDPALKRSIETLPFGSGSGFTNPGAAGNSYVFCVKIGDSEKPWFRSVAADGNWDVLRDAEGTAILSADTLMSLRLADPGDALTPRELPETAYGKAFDAWQVAQHDVFEKWTALTDPDALEPDLPASFRDARDLVISHGTHLDKDDRAALISRLKSVPTTKVARNMRAALNEGGTPEQRIGLVRRVLDEAGITEAPKPEALPEVGEHQVRLVAWMAVAGSGGRGTVYGGELPPSMPAR